MLLPVRAIGMTANVNGALADRLVAHHSRKDVPLDSALDFGVLLFVWPLSYSHIPMGVSSLSLSISHLSFSASMYFMIITFGIFRFKSS